MVVSAREVKGARVIGSVARLGQRDVLLSFFFNDTATTEIYTLSLHDALPICLAYLGKVWDKVGGGNAAFSADGGLDGSFQDTMGSRIRSRPGSMLEVRFGWGVWDTDTATAHCALGATLGLDSALLNGGNGAGG